MLSPSKYEDEDHEVAYVSAIEQTKRHRLSSNEASIDYEDYPEFLDVTKDNVNFEVHMNNEEIENKRSKKEELRLMLNEINKRKEELINANNKLKKREEDLDRLEEELKLEKDNKVKQLREDIKCLQITNDQCRATIQELRNKIAQKQTSNMLQRNSINKITKQNEELRQKIDIINEKCNMKKEEICKIEDSVKLTIKRTNTLKEKIDIYSAETEAYQLKQQEILAKIDHLNYQIEEEDKKYYTMIELIKDNEEQQESSDSFIIEERQSEEDCISEHDDQGNQNQEKEFESQNNLLDKY